MSISVLAEDLESKAHMQILKNAGCDIFQDYYFSKPLALEALRLFIKQQQRRSVSQTA